VRLLLDTHIWLGSQLEPDRLIPKVRSALEDPEAELWLSSISVWELLLGVHTHLRARVALVILAANPTDPLKRRPLMPRVRAALQGRAPGRVVRVAA
jgi:PIN domain nuclease of toxin-antitoxin system